MRRLGLGLICAATAVLCMVPQARAAADDPIFIYRPLPDIFKNPELAPPPAAYLEGPCGLAVDRLGELYVSDYHHSTVDVYKRSDNPLFAYITQIADVDPTDGPCGLALDFSGRLYINDYHRSVARYTPERFPPVPGNKLVEPPVPATLYGPADVIDPVHPSDADAPTGVALHPLNEDIYVDNRTYVSAFQPSGAPVEASGEPLRIGEGTLEDGYGIAVDSAGRVYVPDAGDGTVKIYDPATDIHVPVATIDGSGVPAGHFTSLRDAAIAVDDVSGKVYVADNLQPGNVEEPEAAIYVFSSAGVYLGRLKKNIVDALPPGLAVDNSPEETQGRVYVTSGNTELAAVIAYPPGAETSELEPAEKQFGEAPSGTALPASGAGATSFALPKVTAASKSKVLARKLGGGASASVIQKGNVRLVLGGKLSPQKLPRKGSASVAVAIDWRLSTTDGSAVPNLKKVRIEINRYGRIDLGGLPTCAEDRIQPASSERALNACRASLVGKGSFEADISLEGQDSYPTKGKLLVFKGMKMGKPVLLGQIYSPKPFATSFVIPFAIQKLQRGTYGTALSAKLPAALSSWGNLTAVDMKLSRTYVRGGKRHSVLSAGCPAPKGFPGATFNLTRANFSLAGGIDMSETLTRSCRVR